MQLLLLLLLLAPRLREATDCPNTANTKPLYLLTLASIPDGLTPLSGARIAQDEINNRTGLLPGYHIELIVETIEECSPFTGLSNLVKYTVSPPCRPVVAVNGLGCSSHASLLSSVAGHDGYGLIQLSSANSPIFQTQNHRFPHLWRFLGSAIVYSDTILAIMDHYNWNRIGVVFDVGSDFYSGIANNIEQKVKVSTNKTIEFILAMREADVYLNTAISNIKSHKTTILISLLNLEQEAALLHKAIDENLVYPGYTWIHVERLPQNMNITRGHIYLHIKTSLKTNDTVLVSGELFSEFKRKYKEHIKIIEEQYKQYDLTPSESASYRYTYDQVWAIALAVNNSLPVLEKRNLSIDNYTIGQHEITDVIEEQMANLGFQGAGGWVEFNQYHSVSTPVVEIYWVTGNGTEMLVGLFDPYSHSHLFISIDKNDLPNKIQPPVGQHFLPLSIGSFFYLLDGLVLLLTSSQLALVFYFRNHKAIKATSPHLSILIFLGCYLLCISALVTITISTFYSFTPKIVQTHSIGFTVLNLNGVSLILATITIRLLRVYRIFIFADRFHLSKCWKNTPLAFIAVFLSLIPNILSAIYTVNSLYIESPALFVVTSSLIVLFFYLFSTITFFLAIQTRKIKYKNFKDTKVISYYVALMITIWTYAMPAVMFLLFLNMQLPINGPNYWPTISALLASASLAVAAACQLILFTTKLLPVVRQKFFHETCIPSPKLQYIIQEVHVSQESSSTFKSYM